MKDRAWGESQGLLGECALCEAAAENRGPLEAADDVRRAYDFEVAGRLALFPLMLVKLLLWRRGPGDSATAARGVPAEGEASWGL